MFVVDTNILLYAADHRAAEHQKCRAFLEKSRKQTTPWYLTWTIINEFLRVTTHPKVFPKPFSLEQAWSYLEAVLAAPSLRVLTETETHQAIAAEVFAEMPDIRGNFIFDTHTAILMREHGVKTIYTRDTDFHRFKFLQPIDPLQK